MSHEATDERTGVDWRTFWAAMGAVCVLMVAGWLVLDRLGGSESEPPPQETLEHAPGPDNRVRSLPAELPEGRP